MKISCQNILGDLYADVRYQLVSCLYLEIAIDGLIPHRTASVAIVFTILYGERSVLPTLRMVSHVSSGMSICLANSLASFSLGLLEYSTPSMEMNALFPSEK